MPRTCFLLICPLYNALVSSVSCWIIVLLRRVCLRGHPQTHSDTIKFIMDVLFPESIICSLAGLENLTMLEAEEKFLQVIDISEREQFDRGLRTF
ncbi:PWWP domain-containing DNA repair factor 3A-like [Triplophysa rosa]|uniref:PWWP domain-containing DNA repair factor 3A-like n=1 Tax=Triplophysa rosa TaxID=992332 RepID=UPI002545C331|nr:PWWP domain-containing DNA repair factor 3A-like [Triplophysa rosa]